MNRRRQFYNDRPFLRLDLNFSNGVKASLGDLGSAVTTFTGTNRNRINELGVMETIGANTARIESAGLLNEGQAANLLFSTRTFTAAAGWTLSNVTGPATPDAIGPDGTLSAWIIIDNNNAAIGNLSRAIDKSASDSTTYFTGSLSF